MIPGLAAMRNGIDGLYRIIFMFGTLLFLMGCTSDPVPTYLPANHPANPDAAEVAYTPAPNPFQDKMSMHEMKSMETPSMPHGQQMDSHSPKMKPDPNYHEKSNEIKTEKSDHSH